MLDGCERRGRVSSTPAAEDRLFLGEGQEGDTSLFIFHGGLMQCFAVEQGLLLST